MFRTAFFTAGASAFLSTTFARPTRSSEADQVARTIRTTWKNPSDTLSILLIIGGDIIWKALAQMTGRRIAPVAFSFGWVAYSFSNLMAIAGDGRLMPPPDTSAIVYNLSSGYKRDNRSWVIGRLLRDHNQRADPTEGLKVTVFQTDTSQRAGHPSIDRYWLGGIITIIVQLGIAAIPCGLYGDWGTILLTLAGTLLALATGALPQWRSEKWACRKLKPKDKLSVFAVTGGNGTRTVMIIFCNVDGLNLEDLAGARSPRIHSNPRVQGVTGPGGSLPSAFQLTQLACIFLAALWIIFLITATSLKEHGWFIILVGGIGMLQNVVAAGAVRANGTYGVHLKEVEVFEQREVMDTLMDLECAYKGLGRQLRDEFFPGPLQDDEVRWWDPTSQQDPDEYNRIRLEEGGRGKPAEPHNNRAAVELRTRFASLTPSRRPVDSIPHAQSSGDPSVTRRVLSGAEARGFCTS